MGLFDRIKQSLSKSRENTAAKIDQLEEVYQKIDDDFFEDLTDILVMADVGVKTSEQVVAQLKARCKAEKIDHPGRAREALRDILAGVMGQEPMRLESPMVLLVIGVNGVGKTTSIGKLATRFKTVGRRVVMCAGDTFRAAAADQLEIWSQRADVPLVRQNEGADPAAVVFDGIQVAKARHADILIVDTAGRLHNKAHLMEELKKISRVVAREYPEATMKALLVIDATTGQNGLSQAQVFKDVAQLDGIVLTKLDGTAKGGILAAIARQRPIPVYFIGVGEKVEDLQPFVAEEFADALLGN